MTIGNQFN